MNVRHLLRQLSHVVVLDGSQEFFDEVEIRVFDENIHLELTSAGFILRMPNHQCVGLYEFMGEIFAFYSSNLNRARVSGRAVNQVRAKELFHSTVDYLLAA